MMIAALWGNSAFSESDEGSRARTQIIESLERGYDDAVEAILFGIEEEEEIDTDNPFFAAAERGKARLEQPRNDEGTVRQAIDSGEFTIDQ